MDAMRVAAIAAALHDAGPAAWRSRLDAQVRAAADAGAELVLLPEYVTAPLLAADARWQAWTDLWHTAARDWARSHRMLVVAGTHPVAEGGQLVNRCLLAWPDGSLDHQDKLHPTPWERGWQVAATRRVCTFRHAGARIAVAVCYDVEFPEAVRAQVAAGAEVLLVPSWTDDVPGFWRVRHCTHARCVENVVYAVHAPLVGTQVAPPGFEQACGAAGVLTPCDIGFAARGVAATGGWNQPVVVVAELDLDRLRRQRAGGTVTPWSDRRGVDGYDAAPT
jgi:predicted amidohydrolase